MTVQASEFQDTAERLAHGTTEGDWRSAMSRAYYAVFHFFLDFFLAQGLDLGSGAQAHSSLYMGLNNCGEPTVAPIANDVDDLRRSRVLVDYNLNATVKQCEATRIVQKVESVVNDFQSLLNTVAVADLVDGVRSYLQSIGRLPRP